MKPDIFTMLHNFTEDRPVMKEDNADINAYLTMMMREFIELTDAIELEQGVDAIAEEASDLVIMAIGLIELIGRDPETQIREKILFNILRYWAVLFNGDYDYPEARAIAKTKFTQEDKDEIYEEGL